MLVHRLRRRPNIKQTLAQHFLYSVILVPNFQRTDPVEGRHNTEQTNSTGALRSPHKGHNGAGIILWCDDDD